MSGLEAQSAARDHLTVTLANLREAEQAHRIAVLEALEAGIPLAQVAARAGLSRQTVYTWKAAGRPTED